MLVALICINDLRPNDELAIFIEHPNGIIRDTAQRLLVERGKVGRTVVDEPGKGNG